MQAIDPAGSAHGSGEAKSRPVWGRVCCICAWQLAIPYGVISVTATRPPGFIFFTVENEAVSHMQLLGKNRIPLG
jgi:hypothetical protein